MEVLESTFIQNSVKSLKIPTKAFEAEKFRKYP